MLYTHRHCFKNDAKHMSNLLFALKGFIFSLSDLKGPMEQADTLYVMVINVRETAVTNFEA